jgi:Leucine-rich repeat (LRR) protein
MEYQINKFLTLKLENNRTVIYIDGKPFYHCQRAVLKIPINEFVIPYDDTINNVKSIDEMIELYSSSEYENEYDNYTVTPEEEFHVHCSNIQAWVENDYDTRLMHTHLAFPLLKKLYEIGDETSKKVFKEEIVSRFLSESESVVEYLVNMKYLDYFTHEELLILFDDFSKTRLMQSNLAVPLLKKLYEIGDETSKKVFKEELTTRLLSESESVVEYLVNHKYLDYFTHEELAMIFSEFSHTGLSYLITKKNRLVEYFMSILHLLDSESDLLKNIQVLDLDEDNYDLRYGNRLSKTVYIPFCIDKLTSLKRLKINGIRALLLPESIGNLHSLSSIEFSDISLLKTLPNSIENLHNLQSLTITDSSFELPESIGNLQSLQSLSLINNDLTELPKSFGNLQSLQILDLSYNRLRELPESFGNLQSLQILDLSFNKLQELPESFGNLHSLQELNSSQNFLQKLPESFGNLKSLQRLAIARNTDKKLPTNFDNLSESTKKQYKRLTFLPESFGNLQSLQSLSLINNDLKKLPESFGNLKSLQRLDLANNNLIELPESFCELQSLRRLSIENTLIDNYISTLSPSKKVKLKRIFKNLEHKIRNIT